MTDHCCCCLDHCTRTEEQTEAQALVDRTVLDSERGTVRLKELQSQAQQYLDHLEMDVETRG